MRTINAVVLVLVGSMVMHGAIAAEDWASLLRELGSADPAIVEKARPHYLKLTEELATKRAAEMEPDVLALSSELRSDEPAVRSGAARTLAVLALSRRDSGLALSRALPQLLLGLGDNDLEIRRLSVLAIANLKPIPQAAILPFSAMLPSQDWEIDRMAVAGLATFCETSPQAVEKISALLREGSSSMKQAALQAIGWARCSNGELLRLVEEALRGKDSDVSRVAVETARNLGSKAAALRPSLESLMKVSESALATEAAAALDALR